MKSTECFYILQERFGNDLKIVASQGDSEWGTTHYTSIAYIESFLLKELEKEHNVEGLLEYKDIGIEAVLDNEGIFERDTLDEAIDDLFWYCHEKGLLHNN